MSKTARPQESAERLRDQVVDLAFERGLLTLGCGKSVIRISPPLCITRAEIDEGLEIFEEAISAGRKRNLTSMLPDFRVRQRDYLLEISRALTQELDLDTLLGRILDISIEMLAGQAGLIALRSERGRLARARFPQPPPGFPQYLDPLAGRDSRRSTKTPNSPSCPRSTACFNNLTCRASLGLLTGVGLPLIARQKVIGVIFIFRGYAGMLFHQRPRPAAELCRPGGHRRPERPAVHPGQRGKAAHGCAAGFGRGRHPDS